MPVRSILSPKLEHSVLNTETAKKVALIWLELANLQNAIDFGQPKIDSCYHVWRVPLIAKSSHEGIGKVVIDAYTTLIQTEKTTSHDILKAHLEGRPIVRKPRKKKAKPVYEFDEPILYTTGAFIQPVKLTRKDGSEVWMWVVSEFDGDTFYDGDVHNPQECGDTKEELLSIGPEIDELL